MINYYWISILLLMLVASGCTIHDISWIKDNGVWVSIYDSPASGNYRLHDNKVYGIYISTDDSIKWDSVWSNYYFTPIDYVDLETLYINIIDCDCDYAKDSKYVYCPGFIDYIFWDGDSVIISMTFDGDIRIQGADPKTFKYLGDGYAVDKNGMYSCGEKIEWNDSIIAHYIK